MGEVFAGRYELIDQIGLGGMGSVWRVRDLRADAVVAAKVLRQSDAVAVLRFVREQAVRIHHPHIIVPLGWAGEDDRVLFTMPVVEGGS
ncbi:MAG TPA: serine/threonine protein kinase, partial [Arachnia sp.]|nr:serine/threonine protein kinase [Arachnia sp.]